MDINSRIVMECVCRMLCGIGPS